MINKTFFRATILSLLALVFSKSSIAYQDGRLDLMPVPAQYEMGNGNLRLASDFRIVLSGEPDDRLLAASTRFLNRLSNRTGLFLKEGYVTKANFKGEGVLNIQINRPGKVVLHEDEAYDLNINATGIKLEAETDLGAMHGLETLLQLLKPASGGFEMPYIQISDNPRFPWRGLMIDVARHFQPMEVLKRNIDGMAAVKMNVLHLHLTDDQGFRVESKSYPILHEKGSDGQYYTQRELKTIVQYAADRGIRVVPEFDVPGHATSWLTAMPELGSLPGKDRYVLERNAGIFDPTLDPTNEQTYVVLEAVFKEMAAIFTDEYFHIGGDENEGKHWDANPAIQAFMKEKGLGDNHQLQNHFNKRVLSFLETFDKKMVGWDEILQPGLPKTAVIQSWRGIDALVNSASKGYQTFLSNGFYIDLMYRAKDHYVTDPLPDDVKLTDDQKKLILGGEATMWAELVIPHTVDSRIWPRTAVIAERLWSPASVKDIDDMYRRMDLISVQLEEHGLQHLSSQDVILRKLSAGANLGPLKVLHQVSSPLQRYTRNPGGTMYQSYSPFMLWADATLADSKTARKFDASVTRYLNQPNAEDAQYLQLQLNQWHQNHEQLKQVIDQSPLLKEIEGLSEQLMELSALGLEAMNLHQNRSQPDLNWLSQAEVILKKARQQGGRTELMNVAAVEQLVKSVMKLDNKN